MSARRAARVAAWPFEQVGKALIVMGAWYWYLFLTMFPITHAWMHMRHDQQHRQEDE